MFLFCHFRISIWCGINDLFVDTKYHALDRLQVMFTKNIQNFILTAMNIDEFLNELEFSKHMSIAAQLNFLNSFITMNPNYFNERLLQRLDCIVSHLLMETRSKSVIHFSILEVFCALIFKPIFMEQILLKQTYKEVSF